MRINAGTLGSPDDSRGAKTACIRMLGSGLDKPRASCETVVSSASGMELMAVTCACSEPCSTSEQSPGRCGSQSAEAIHAVRLSGVQKTEGVRMALIGAARNVTVTVSGSRELGKERPANGARSFRPFSQLTVSGRLARIGTGPTVLRSFVAFPPKLPR